MKAIATEFNPIIVAGGVKEIMKGLGASSSDLWKVPPKDLHVMENLNVRVQDKSYTTKVEAIAQSIMDEGFHPDQPIGVFVHEGKLYVSSGHRRRDAALLAIEKGADLEFVPVVVKPRSTSIQDLTAELVTANNGEPLTAYELACVCKRLVNFQWDTKKIASRLGISVTYADQLLTLMGAPMDLLALVHEGKMAAGTAHDLFKKHGAKVMEAATKAVDTAKEKGREKATAKDVEGAKLKRALNKNDPTMFEVLRELRNDSAATKIKKDLWERIQAVIDAVESSE